MIRAFDWEDLPLVDAEILESAIRSAERAMGEQFQRSNRELHSLKARFAADGRLRSSAYIITCATKTKDGFLEGSKAFAVRLAEILGPKANALAEQTLRVLQAAADQELANFAAEVAILKNDSAGAMVIERETNDIRNSMAAIAKGVADDLSLGIADGKRVEGRQTTINIDNRGGAGQFAINSVGAHQLVGGNQGTGLDIAAVQRELASIREALQAQQIDQTKIEIIGDAILNFEREVTAPNPNPGRLKRLFRLLFDVIEKVGVSAAATAATKTIERLLL